ELVRGIGALPDALAEAAPGRLAGRFEASAVDVVDPAVIAAANTALHRNAVLERRPTMRAVQVQHAQTAAAIAEDHQVLAEDSPQQRRGRETARARHRLQDPPQVLATRCPRAHLRQLGIRRRDVTAVISAEWAGLLLRRTPLHDTPSTLFHDTISLAPANK